MIAGDTGEQQLANDLQYNPHDNRRGVANAGR